MSGTAAMASARTDRSRSWVSLVGRDTRRSARSSRSIGAKRRMRARRRPMRWMAMGTPASSAKATKPGARKLMGRWGALYSSQPTLITPGSLQEFEQDVGGRARGVDQVIFHVALGQAAPAAVDEALELGKV